MARRFGSAMISNTDSTCLVYCTEHIRVKVYTDDRGQQRFQPSSWSASSDAEPGVPTILCA
jgi:hypothetical protein